MRAARWDAPGSLSVVDLDEPSPGAGQAVIEVDRCGICGSDLHSFHSGLAARPGQVLGHEFSGRVVAASAVEGLSPGDRVTVRPLVPCGRCDRCLSGDVHLCEAGNDLYIGYETAGAFAERVLVPRAIVGQTVFHLPEDVTLAAGALVEPLAVALRAVRLSGLEPGDSAVVLGAGPIGLGVVQFLALGGADPMIAVDPSALRREKALELGANLVVDPSAEDVVAVARGFTGAGAGGRGARIDRVIECSGSSEAVETTLKVVRNGGSVVFAAVYGRRIEMAPDLLVGKELRLQGSFAYRDEFPRVIELLRRGRLRAETMVSHTFALEHIVEAFRVQSDRDASLKVLVAPDRGD